MFNWAVFIAVLTMVESGGNDSAVGDLRLKHHAYGAAQIRLPYLRDVNRLCHEDVIRTFGRPLTEKDMFDPVKACWAVQRYVCYWGMAYSKETGQQLDFETAARIHHAGPSGWRWWHISGRVYWKFRFQPELQRYLEEREAKDGRP